MELSSAHWHPTTAEKLIVLFCLVWPFVAAALMSRRGRSASPVAAALVPLAVCAAGAWLSLHRVQWARAITGSGRISTAAGIAQALSMFYIGGCFALVVIVFAALRRHRPILDRRTAILVALFLANAAGAIFAGAAIADRAMPPLLLIAGAITAGGIAAVAIVWTVLTGRGRVVSTGLPYGVTVAAILIATMGVMVWQIAHDYLAIAMGR